MLMLEWLGTYQQYITSPAKYTSPIPEGVSDYIAGPIMCSASTMHRALLDSQLKPGQWVVFPGGGGGVGIQVSFSTRASLLDIVTKLCDTFTFWSSQTRTRMHLLHEAS